MSGAKCVEQYCDGTLSAERTAALEQFLRDDPQPWTTLCCTWHFTDGSPGISVAVRTTADKERWQWRRARGAKGEQRKERREQTELVWQRPCRGNWTISVRFIIAHVSFTVLKRYALFLSDYRNDPGHCDARCLGVGASATANRRPLPKGCATVHPGPRERERAGCGRDYRVVQLPVGRSEHSPREGIARPHRPPLRCRPPVCWRSPTTRERR